MDTAAWIVVTHEMRPRFIHSFILSPVLCEVWFYFDEGLLVG
jgi:hypothetical protein